VLPINLLKGIKLPQGLKPAIYWRQTARLEAAPLQSKIKLEFFGRLSGLIFKAESLPEPCPWMVPSARRQIGAVWTCIHR
jgi:hypothetical protein